MRNQVRAARETAGMTQAELAWLAGISPRHLTRIEAGARGPSLRVARALANALAFPIHELFPERKGA